MKDIKSNVFNETMSSLLIDLRNTVDNLSPEHIKMLPVNLVDKARVFTESEFIFDDGAMVNSVDGYKLNGMIRWLTSNNMEYLVGGFNWAVDPDDTTLQRVIIDRVHKLPDGWDGRNGFAFFKDVSEPLLYAKSNAGEGKINAHLVITSNKSNIILNGYYYNKYNVNTGPITGQSIKDEGYNSVTVRYILWRSKDV